MMNAFSLSLSIYLPMLRPTKQKLIIVLTVGYEVFAVFQIDQRVRYLSLSLLAGDIFVLISIDHLLAIQLDDRHDHLKLLRLEDFLILFVVLVAQLLLGRRDASRLPSEIIHIVPGDVAEARASGEAR